MSLENDLKSGKFLGLDSLEKLVRLRKQEQKNGKGFRELVKNRLDALRYNDPNANILALVKGIRLIQRENPDSAKLLDSILLLTQRFGRSHQQALEIIAHETKQSVQFVHNKELEAVRRVMDALESSKILQLA